MINERLDLLREAGGEPRQTSGLVDGEPGLYFVGQQFQHSVSSTMIHGVVRDAAFIVRTIRERSPLRALTGDRSSGPLEDARAHVA